MHLSIKLLMSETYNSLSPSQEGYRHCKIVLEDVTEYIGKDVYWLERRLGLVDVYLKSLDASPVSQQTVHTRQALFAFKKALESKAWAMQARTTSLELRGTTDRLGAAMLRGDLKKAKHHAFRMRVDAIRAATSGLALLKFYQDLRQASATAEVRT